MQHLRIVICILSFSSMYAGTASQASAQEYKYEFGGRIGELYYSGDAARKGLLTSPGVELSAVARYNIDFRRAISGSLSYMAINGNTRFSDNAFPEGKSASFSTRMCYLDVTAEFNFLPYSNKYKYLGTSRGTPYIGAGLGLGVFKAQGKIAVAPAAHLTAGFKYKISDRWDAALSWIGARLLSDRLDTPSAENPLLDNPFNLRQSVWHSGDGFGRFSISLTYNFGTRASDCTKKAVRKKLPKLKFK